MNASTLPLKRLRAAEPATAVFGDHNDEWGSFALDELEAFKGAWGIGIERDLYFGEKRFSEVLKK